MFDKKKETVAAGLETSQHTVGEVTMNDEKMKTVLTPAFVTPRPVPLSTEIRQAIAAVREPLHISHHPDGKNKTWVLCAGAPRVGVDAAFARRITAHPKFTLAKVTLGSNSDLTFSNYLFTHPEDTFGQLGAFLEEAIANLRREAFEMPVPFEGPMLQVNARVEPACANPLDAFFGALESLSGSGPLPVLSLSGRRYYLGRPNAQWGFDIQAVVTAPHGSADAARTEQFQNHLGASDGWTGDARRYAGAFIDTLTGAFRAFGTGEGDEPVPSYSQSPQG
ncbi:hypothetical protein [Frigoriglobus tundricola]|uniref:Uncharacterized protein n=1 Tax=Frigoriglobus tundricola TaxID=2774151 RepID=A0A6M5YWG6_9BACT|nr:hypothetical protein [Frigoriglobus tundricola]QJW97272.1 hypothetical protein FTUN_4842 [Frigoriglobus tundricola]